MRIYRRYRCEFGHEWITESEDGESASDEELLCPEGHKAVTMNEEPPADEVQVVIRPAARIVDSVTGRVWKGGRYYLILLDREDRQAFRSSRDYSWDEAVKLATLFKGKTLESAGKWWERKAP